MRILGTMEHATNDWLNSTIEFVSFHWPNAKKTDPVKSLSRKPINWNQINGWIEESETRHDLKPKGSLVLPKEFRVIDVERDKVVLAPDHCQFVALSYVCGEAANDLMLCGSNIQQLAVDFSISRTDLPANIEDSMIACAKVGKRHLWVDRLCIIQDGGDEIKLAQIERIGDIYSSAFFTTVGACGDGARSGLAGFNGRPRLRAPWVISLNGMILIEEVDTSFEGTLEAIPKWHTRGWTYQEFALSFRLLIFTELGLCYMSNPREKSNTGNMQAFEFLPNYFSCLQPYHAEIEDTRHMIEQYTQRYLTCDNDIIRAFSGILNQFGSCHQSGMPLANFDDNLFWWPYSWNQASRTHNSSGAVFFPSWSWSSVIGPVIFDYFFNHVPVTTWAYISPKEGNFVILSRRMQSYGWHQLAHKEGFYDLKHLIDLRDDHCKNYSNAECCEDCCKYCRTRVQMNMERKVSVFRKIFFDEDINAATVSGRLLLLTQTARLRLEFFDTIAGTSSTKFSVWNEDGQWTGIIRLSESNAELIVQMLKNGDMAFFDFAAISIYHMWDGSQPLRRFFDNSSRFGMAGKAPLAREDELKLFHGSEEKFFQEVRYERLWFKTWLTFRTSGVKYDAITSA
ncbi:hypothetical protein EYC80_010813 [Monilinia laxa]|uniref:Heterokaryon incompatibility domain-containing protein n=1 Tax=Monilinia laxa TaxID=61186 RepID=A0A5N6JRW6_MONLA|nr:hypothetical protein EYC80_010813 [Monilinia laxa]